MDLTSPQIIKELLKKQGSAASKRLGQRFLIDKTALRKIIEASQLSPQDTILEIGPGIGTLTQELAKRAKGVVAIEKDPKMIDILRQTLAGFNNVEVIQGDALDLKIQVPKSYKLVANLPYYITSPVIRQFLEIEARPLSGQEATEVRPMSPSLMVLMVQKEVAQRIVARPPDMSLLAVSVQFYAKPEIISYVSKSCFWPQPKVDSAIIKIIPDAVTSDRTQLRQKKRGVFFRIVKAGFSQPRKQLANNLAGQLKLNRAKAEEWLLKNNIQPSQRAETLTIEDWLKLTESYKINQ